MSLFETVESAPRDPILGLSEQFNADTNPAKINLGVGVYLDEDGRLPLLRCVAEVERSAMASPESRGYLPIDGIAAYDRAVQTLVFGADSALLEDGRVATVQALGGTGGLKVGADLLRKLAPEATVLISDPTWENHRALFGQAGFRVETYPYYDARRRDVDFDAMQAALSRAAPGSIVVLHACCHNPTGCDLAPVQWTAVVETMKARRLTPFLDMAYQGFGEGIAEDGETVRRFVTAGIDCFVSTSFSKSFSLYGERVGALSVVCGNRSEAERVLSQLKIVIRANYSTPPTHGAKTVAAVLNTPALRAAWEDELAAMRERIRSMRRALTLELRAAGVEGDLAYIERQKGMFSYSGLGPAQMQRLRRDFGVYGLDSGRICVAALNDGNVRRVARSMAQVMTRSPDR